MKLSVLMPIVSILLLAAFSPAMAGLELVAGSDFESDTLGEHPDASLPAGFFPTFSSGVGSYSVVDDLGVMNSQSLRAERSSGAGSFNFGMNLPIEAYTKPSFRLKWRFAAITGGAYMFVVLRGPNLAIHGSLTMTGSTVLFSTADPALGEIQVASYVQGEAIDFDWTLDRETGIQTLLINGAVVIEALETRYKTVSVDATRFAFEGAFQSAITVAIDDLEIYAGTGTTPTEATTWGEVKALYR